jgi:hypothetical protein
MREATSAEYEKARMYANQPPRYLHTARMQDIQLYDRCTMIASESRLFRKGARKPHTVSYQVNVEYFAVIAVAEGLVRVHV